MNNSTALMANEYSSWASALSLSNDSVGQPIFQQEKGDEAAAAARSSSGISSSSPLLQQLEQGTQPNCFLIAALSMLCCTRPEIIENLFVTKVHPFAEKQEEGKYEFQFFVGGEGWKKIQTDGQIPVVSSSSNTKKVPLHVVSATHHAWPLLLVKGYACFYGSFEALEGGNISECLRDLTGRPVESIHRTSELNFNSQTFWVKLAKALEHREVVCCAGTLPKQQKNFDLQSGHAYGIHRVHIISSAKSGEDDSTAHQKPDRSSLLLLNSIYICLINPYKKHPYQGPMDAKDKRWTTELSQSLLGTKNWEQALTSNPGRFVMSAQDFCLCFASVHMCFLEPSSDGLTMSTEVSALFKGAWKEGSTAGGCSENNTWRFNPKYLLRNETAKAQEVKIVLGLKDRRAARISEGSLIGYPPAGVRVVGVRDEKQQSSGDKGKKETGKDQEQEQEDPFYLMAPNTIKTVLHNGKYVNQRESTTSFVLPPRSEAIAVPSTYAPGISEAFYLQCYFPAGSVKVYELQHTATEKNASLSFPVPGAGTPTIVDKSVVLSEDTSAFVLVKCSTEHSSFLHRLQFLLSQSIPSPSPPLSSVTAASAVEKTSERKSVASSYVQLLMYRPRESLCSTVNEKKSSEEEENERGRKSYVCVRKMPTAINYCDVSIGMKSPQCTKSERTTVQFLLEIRCVKGKKKQPAMLQVFAASSGTEEKEKVQVLLTDVGPLAASGLAVEEAEGDSVFLIDSKDVSSVSPSQKLSPVATKSSPQPPRTTTTKAVATRSVSPGKGQSSVSKKGAPATGKVSSSVSPQKEKGAPTMKKAQKTVGGMADLYKSLE